MIYSVFTQFRILKISVFVIFSKFCSSAFVITGFIGSVTFMLFAIVVDHVDNIDQFVG